MLNMNTKRISNKSQHFDRSNSYIRPAWPGEHQVRGNIRVRGEFDDECNCWSDDEDEGGAHNSNSKEQTQRKRHACINAIYFLCLFIVVCVVSTWLWASWTASSGDNEQQQQLAKAHSTSLLGHNHHDIDTAKRQEAVYIIEDSTSSSTKESRKVPKVRGKAHDGERDDQPEHHSEDPSARVFEALIYPTEEERVRYLQIADRICRRTSHTASAATASDSRSARSDVIITIAASNYKALIVNWILHLQLLNISHYLIICVDEDIYTFLADSEHTILWASSLLPIRFAKQSLQLRQKMILRKSKKYKTISDFNELLKENENNNRKLSAIELQQTVPNDMSELSHMNQNQLKRAILNRFPELYDRISQLNISTETYIANLSKKLKRIYEQHSFSILMLLKQIGITWLLEKEFTVVWSDCDCVWLRKCVLEGVDVLHQPALLSSLLITAHHNPSPTTIDLIVQQGLHPFDVSSVLGASICTGLMLIRPTRATTNLFAAVRDELVRSMRTIGTYHNVSAAEKAKVSGDQAVINHIILANSYSIAQGSPLSYGLNATTAKYVTSATLQFIRVELAVRNNLSNPARKNTDTRDTVNDALVIGFLPYDYYPRGDARLETPSYTTKQGSLSLRDHVVGSSVSVSNLVYDKLVQQMLRRNRNEWSLLRHQACVWHMYALKSEGSKVDILRRDGVYINRSST